jgi:hypothetical protein
MYEWIISHWKLWRGSAPVAGAAKWVKTWFDLLRLTNARLRGKRVHSLECDSNGFLESEQRF